MESPELMAEILLDEQAAPAAPSAGQLLLYPDSAISQLTYKNDASRGFIASRYSGHSNADQLLAAADTYVTDSGLLVPSFGIQTRTLVRWWLSLSKTAAGAAAPVWNIRIGTLGTTGDTARWTHTGVAQTAAAETGLYILTACFRNAGAACTIAGTLECTRTGGTAATGLASVPAAQVTSAAFDSSFVLGQIIGLSINAGASSAWTITQCHVDMDF
jgi:hypothetical protein